MQYTLRDIPRLLDKALRRKAKEEGKSLNQTALDALSRGLELAGTPVLSHDLDWIAGTWREDAEFDKAIAEQQQIDPEYWK